MKFLKKLSYESQLLIDCLVKGALLYGRNQHNAVKIFFNIFKLKIEEKKSKKEKSVFLRTSSLNAERIFKTIDILNYLSESFDFFEHLLKRSKNSFMKTLGKLQVFLHPKEILYLFWIVDNGESTLLWATWRSDDLCIVFLFSY